MSDISCPYCAIQGLQRVAGSAECPHWAGAPSAPPAGFVRIKSIGRYVCECGIPMIFSAMAESGKSARMLCSGACNIAVLVPVQVIDVPKDGS